MLQELTSEVIDCILMNQLIGRIGCAVDNKVLIEPVMYMYDGRFIYGHTREGTKVEMLRKNPNTCFEVDEIVTPHFWRSVIVQGVYEELEGDDRLDALRRLGERTMPLFADEHAYGGYPDKHGPRSVVYRIRISSKTGRSETKQSYGGMYDV